MKGVLCVAAALALALAAASSDTSVWYQVVVWPTDDSVHEPLYEVSWHIDAAVESPEAPLHSVSLPPNLHWSAQYTVAEALPQRHQLALPSGLLSLELRQISALHYIVVVEMTDDADLEALAEFVDNIVGGNGTIRRRMVHSRWGTSKLAEFPLELFDFWRLDLRLEPDSFVNLTRMPDTSKVFIAQIVGHDLLPFSFFQRSADIPASPLLHWLQERQKFWVLRSLSDLVPLTKYIRLVGEYALFSEITQSRSATPAVAEAADLPSFGTFQRETLAAEVEMVLGSWGPNHSLHGHILRLVAADRVAMELSSPIATTARVPASRKLLKHGFHRSLDTHMHLQLPDAAFPQVEGQCSLVMFEFLPESTYVDLDELERMRQFGGPDFFTNGAMDIQAPASYSTQNVVMLQYHNISRSRFESQDDAGRWFNTSLPIHFRYHSAALKQDYAMTELVPPLVFIRCDSPAFDVACAKTGSIWPQPFMVEAKLFAQCPGWTRLLLKFERTSTGLERTEDGYSLYREDGIISAPIPIGKLEHRVFVAIGTFASTWLGAILLSCVIIDARRQSNAAAANRKAKRS